MNNKKANNLITAAKELIDKRSDDKNHTVAAAVLTKSDKIITSINFYHFTGGPCAEIAALARVASEGEEPVMIATVGNKNRGVLTPCGRCRQTIFDYYPNVQVLISNDDVTKAIKDLLPDTFNWNDQ